MNKRSEEKQIGLLLMFNSLVGGQVLVWLTALLLVIWGGVGI